MLYFQLMKVHPQMLAPDSLASDAGQVYRPEPALAPFALDPVVKWETKEISKTESIREI